MHPPLSIIAFTVLSGAGYGLLALLGLGPVLGIGQSPDRALALTGGITALVLVTAGLGASTGHLANPRNVWRALFRWRTSWLSREGVLALATYPFALAWLAGWWGSAGTEPVPGWVSTAGAVAGLLGVATMLSTGMIYACLRTVRQWRTPLTPLNYLLIGLALGALLAAWLGGSPAASGAALVLVVLALIAKVLWLVGVGQPASVSIEAATSLRRATVRLLDVGHSAGTFLTREFLYEVARSRLLMLRAVAIGAMFVIPALVHLGGTPSAAASGLAALCAIGGALVERWLFFAEARHAVTLFHGAART
ncbi:MAG: dimethyl sulfoxide reductase anchor subunit [Chromatiales bacterium]|nr:dimethyl sulfoxide reductase anchor subunit [Chromatiales bacterium]